MKLRWHKELSLVTRSNWRGKKTTEVRHINKFLEVYDEELKDWVCVETYNDIDEYEY